MASRDPGLVLLDERATAEALGLSVHTLRRSRCDRPDLIDNDHCPEPYGQGRRVYYLACEVEELGLRRGNRQARGKSH